MNRPGRATRRPRRAVGRPGIEALEGRDLPTGIGFLSGIGLGATGKSSAIRSNAVATDAAGDTYLTGSFRGTTGFDPASSSSTFTTAGTQDTFVAKYGPAGNLLWARTFAGRSTTSSGGFTTYAVGQGSAIAVDASGEVFVAGSFGGTISLTGAQGVTQATSATSATEPYVAKLDPTGNVAWFDAVAGTAYDTDSANALALDGSGGAVVAGTFAESASFGPISLTAAGSNDAFVARVDGSGSFTWAVATRGANGSNASAQGVAVDASGNVDLAGSFSGTVAFGPPAATTQLTSAGSVDAVLWKLDRSGALAWARSYGSTDYDAATAVAVDASGDLLATGAFSGTVNFGTSARPDAITAGPIYDAFVLKVDPNGNEVRVGGLVGPGGSSKGQGIAVDPSGTVHVAGTFSGSLDFDPGPGTDVLASVGSSDAFVAGYDPGGALAYALQAGTANFNASLGVAVNAVGTVAITGTYSGPIVFGPSTLPTYPAGAFVAQAVTQVPPPAPSAPALEASSDTGISQSDGITSDTSPVLDVTTAGPSNLVELLRNGVIVAHRQGPGAIMDPGPLADGIYTYTAVQVSTAGLIGPTSPAGPPVTILTVPPAPLAAPTLLAADDSGVVGDGLTNVRQPRLVVVAKGGTTVQVLDASGSVIGSATLASGGAGVVSPLQPLADGAYSLRVRAVDVAGNASPASPALSLTIDATAPAAPSAPALLAADDSGVVGDGVTNLRQPRLTGSAEPGSSVRLVDGSGNPVGSAVAGATGSFTARPAAPLADGSYAIHAVATDAAGNVGPAGPSFALTILATPPAAPSAPTLLPADDSAGPGLTNVRQPRLTGSAKAGTTVDLFTGSGTLLAVAVVGAGGGYTAKVASPLADGLVIVDAVAFDAAGNASPASPALSLTIDATAPAAPSAPALLAADDSGVVGDGVTNLRQPRLTGSAEPGSSVRLVDASGNPVGSAVAGANGSFTARPAAPLADGSYAIHAVATDAAGNVGPAGPSFALTILATPPAAPSAPSLLAADDSGTLGDRITNVRQPRLTGSATPGLTVRLVNATNVVLGTATASASGAFTIPVGSAFADGTYSLAFIAGDAAGNVSPAGASIALTILATPPPQPAAPGLLGADDTGVAGDGQTSVRRPRIAGIAALGGRVDWLAANGSVIASTTASASNGSYQLQSPTALANGLYPAKVRETDVAGNVSPTSPAFNLTIRVAPGDDFGDGITDVSVFRKADATFFVRQPATGALYARQFGGAGDVPINGDFFGNGHADIAVYRPGTGTFYALDPVTGASKAVPLGQAGDVPVPADYDGDGQADFAVFRPSTSTFVILSSITNATSARTFGGAGDVPVPADYFGNGHADLAVYRPSTATFFAFDPIGGGTKVVAVGSPNATPVPADYEGLGHVDPAVYQPGNSTFVIQLSATNSALSRPFGGPGDIPVPGDYLGNGRADLAVYRPSNATLFALDIPTSASKVVSWGTPNTTPPTLAPITYWFAFGRSPGRYVPGRPGPLAPATSPPVLDFATPPESSAHPIATPVTPDREAGAVDRAIESLGLERWRPGA